MCDRCAGTRASARDFPCGGRALACVLNRDGKIETGFRQTTYGEGLMIGDPDELRKVPLTVVRSGTGRTFRCCV
jgi:hypothetical protein